ncbi:SGNH/GDSL hydrolase family protein [Prosthecobacter sp.]|uniref:SGNH/GDSL hydrolase family protein n=1 Tax=Prosthecobacter sp. TaxID=1965333 RepID=UPI002ABCEE8C|nr:SGNH/GDSL hydrolase family protein [Prosthecobacter sp.]MDZ4402630.1 SGNH/GDSL hydrolase family protein [Prosthecobacter sp.]
MRILLFLLACVSLLSAAPLKTAQLLAAGREPVRIVCIGDSITGVYYHTGGLRAYPEMLQIALQKIHPQAQVTVRNAGISGDTTTGGLKRLERDVLAHKPHLVTVMFGMNDLVRTPVVDFQNNLREIIRRCRAIDTEVVLCTQNSILETSARPVAKFAEFTQAIRDVAKAESLIVADCFGAYEAVRTKDSLDWTLLHSDAIHPNMDGHKLFAETIAQAISGKAISLKDIGPPLPALRHTLALLKAGKPVKVLAMPPYDTLIAPAIQQFYPKAVINVTSWPTEGQTLAQLEESAKKVRTMQQDLVIIAVPGSLPVQQPESFHKSYSWIMNWSLSFGLQQWDVIAALPSATKTPLTPEEQQHVAIARRLIESQDLHMLAGDASALTTLLTQHLKPQN